MLQYFLCSDHQVFPTFGFHLSELSELPITFSHLLVSSVPVTEDSHTQPFPGPVGDGAVGHSAALGGQMAALQSLRADTCRLSCLVWCYSSEPRGFGFSSCVF